MLTFNNDGDVTAWGGGVSFMQLGTGYAEKSVAYIDLSSHCSVGENNYIESIKC